MIFLIEYSRREGVLVQFRSFSDQERAQAQAVRLETELRLNQENIDHEVVILEASSEQALRKTHRRYFEDIGQLSSDTPHLPPTAARA